MRLQIAAANWKMNLTLPQAEALLNGILPNLNNLPDHHQAIFAVPFPYLSAAKNKTEGLKNVFVAAQNIYNKKSGAYTGEVSAEMLQSINIRHVILGHSERREYFSETNQILAEKIDLALTNNLTPIFCCGEPLSIREAGTQNEFVATQLRESLYHLPANDMEKIVIAYEPIWAIGTGKTATSQQAQDIQAFIRKELAGKYGAATANNISILYGGSVKASNAQELFSQPDVDGGLVGGASLIADEFNAIIKALKSEL
jgi:triosephosphate isomerase